MNIFRRKAGEPHKGRREARFAGTWYESDRNRLENQMDGFLVSARNQLVERPCDPLFSDNPEPINKGLLALIVPHAGYMFSGSTAAYAYEFAGENTKPERVFLLGPSHYVGFEGIALSQCKSFETPLGDLKVDRDCVNELGRFPFFQTADEVHQREHSLELQLSFIKHVFGDVKLIPLVVGMFKEEEDIKLAGQILKRHLGDSDLVVVSSDFTHYGPRYDYVPFERDFPNRVKSLDEDAFGFIRDGDLDGFLDFHDRTGCTICGFYPCSLLLSMLPDDTRASLLKYGTSRDSYKEDSKNSVSYLALVLTSARGGWESKESQDTFELTVKEKKDALALARLVVEHKARGEKVPGSDDLNSDIGGNLAKELGVFVTLFKRKPGKLLGKSAEPRSDKELRGCIGYIWPVKPLYQAIVDNAVGAASRDPRFPPVKANELKDLQIEISVLTPLKPVSSIEEIEIGRHGVVFYCQDSQSVFLPHVATEFGWDREETLNQLALKAGLKKDAWKSSEARFDVFESIMFEEFEDIE